jgi:hypothetical protein
MSDNRLASKRRTRIWAGIIGFAAAFAFGIGGYFLVKDGEIYRTACAYAASDNDLKMQVGTPMEYSLSPMYRVVWQPNGGWAKIILHVSGPLGNRTVHFNLTENASEWRVKEEAIE